MTLNEYITQSEPQANAKVILQEGEYIQRDAIKVAPFSVHTAVDIPAIAKHYGIKDNYIRIGTVPAVVYMTSPNGRTARKHVFPARRCPGAARTHPISPVLKGKRSFSQTMVRSASRPGRFTGM
ncbi:hypothetical protein [Alistipes putredinis]|uniref:hypothetical protein n=1 Tax=Alistipes putredinis TaxID=28117 RepID=UPI00399270B4